jgi:DNA-directed RNA polymerase specialized sigma subunit
MPASEKQDNGKDLARESIVVIWIRSRMWQQAHIEDLIQEGAIGIWESLKRYPNAANKYLPTKDRWSTANVSRGAGA